MPPDPAMTGLADQILASSTHAGQLLTSMGAVATGSFSPEAADRWVQDVRARVMQCFHDGSLQICPHLTGPQPTVALAERPGAIMCWPCYTAAARTCLTCSRPVGGDSARWGREHLARGPAVTYSRVLCTPCVGTCEPGGTFGSGR